MVEHLLRDLLITFEFQRNCEVEFSLQRNICKSACNLNTSRLYITRKKDCARVQK